MELASHLPAAAAADGRPAGVARIVAQHQPVKTEHHLAKALHPTPRVLREAMGDVEGFNAKFAVLITRLVGTMWCAYLFGVIALIGLGPALKPGGEGIVSWIAQTFLQLVLLSVIMVGQNVQSLAADARSNSTYRDAEVILDRLDVKTQGGLKAILDRLDELGPAALAGVTEQGLPGAGDQPPPASPAPPAPPESRQA